MAVPQQNLGQDDEQKIVNWVINVREESFEKYFIELRQYFSSYI